MITEQLTPYITFNSRNYCTLGKTSTKFVGQLTFKVKRTGECEVIYELWSHRLSRVALEHCNVETV